MTATLREQSDEQIDALQSMIEVGGLDRDLMIELRRQFLAMTDRDTRKTDRENEHECKA